MKITLPVVTLFLCLCITLPSNAQTPPAEKPATASQVNVTLKGQVVDSLTNESVPFATLKITESENPERAVKLFATDADGKFDIVLTQAGKFDLHTQSVGKSPMVVPFEVTGKEKTINLGKMNLSDIQLGEIVVTAIRVNAFNF